MNEITDLQTFDMSFFVLRFEITNHKNQNHE